MVLAAAVVILDHLLGAKELGNQKRHDQQDNRHNDSRSLTITRFAVSKNHVINVHGHGGGSVASRPSISGGAHNLEHLEAPGKQQRYIG